MDLRQLSDEIESVSRRYAERLGIELAGVLCHVILLARHHDVELGTEIERKWVARTGDGHAGR